MRVILAAVAFTALSFAAGVAGDLTRPLPAHGESVVVRIPPPIPGDAPRAAPLPLVRTAAASAEAPRSPRQLVRTASVVAELAVTEPKPRADLLWLHTSTKFDDPARAKEKARKQGE